MYLSAVTVQTCWLQVLHAGQALIVCTNVLRLSFLCAHWLPWVLTRDVQSSMLNWVVFAVLLSHAFWTRSQQYLDAGKIVSPVLQLGCKAYVLLCIYVLG